MMRAGGIGGEQINELLGRLGRRRGREWSAPTPCVATARAMRKDYH
jgi:hypothetical protein